MKPSQELFRLTKSLTKSEKRFFKLLSSLQSGEKNYIKLFDAIEKQNTYDESAIKNQFKNETFIKHLPSEKNHLYKLILKSLRSFYSENSISAVLAEHMQSIEILYNKALYAECGKLIKKGKKLAEAHERFYYLFELIRWEKMLLEEEYQSGNFSADLNKVIEEEKWVIRRLRNLAEYQILYSKVNYVFRQGGFIRNEGEESIINEILSHELILGKNTALSKRAAATCYYVKGLCAITKNEVEDSFSNFSKVVKIFEANPNLIQDIPKQYIKSLGNLFYYYIRTGEYGQLTELIDKMRLLKKQLGFNRIDIEIRIFITTHYFEMLALERQGNYRDALAMIEPVKRKLEEFGDKVTKEDEVLFEYLIANVYFGSEQYRDALRQLNNVLNDNESNLRQDVYNFAKLFNLVIHYELGNFDLLEYLVKSSERFFLKSKKSTGLDHLFELSFIRSFKKVIKSAKNASRTNEHFTEMKSDLSHILKDHKEGLALEYFDYIAWVDSKLKSRSYSSMRTSPDQPIRA